VDEKQIALVLKGEKAKPPPPKEANRPIYTRMSRRHLSIETLNKFRVDYEFDHVSYPYIRPLFSSNGKANV